MLSSTLRRKIQIVEGCFDDYKELAPYHYRDARLGPFTNIFAIKPKQNSSLDVKIIGVAVYSMPNPSLELRNIATGNFFIGLDKSTQIALLNKNVRRISRVIMEPRFRGLGLAAKLVRETMPLLKVPIIEASGIMGAVNPFLVKAGMTPYTAPQKASSVRLKEALRIVGIKESLFVDPRQVHNTIELLCERKKKFIEREFRVFLKSFGNKRYSVHSQERTRFVLTRLTERPTYYIWFNKST
ncbi:MAG: hypothetical protein P8016_01515 [Sedimentisphaerales bacterium]|jgi:hypothetical protein